VHACTHTELLRAGLATVSPQCGGAPTGWRQRNTKIRHVGRRFAKPVGTRGSKGGGYAMRKVECAAMTWRHGQAWRSSRLRTVERRKERAAPGKDGRGMEKGWGCRGHPVRAPQRWPGGAHGLAAVGHIPSSSSARFEILKHPPSYKTE
jgi:hypothetical protein